MRHMTEVENLCVAVLRGDQGATLALYDELHERFGVGGAERDGAVLPATKLTVSVDRIRVVLILKDDVTFDPEGRDELTEIVQGWLRDPSGEPLILAGVDRIELYEMPETPRPRPRPRPTRTGSRFLDALLTEDDE